MSIGVRRPFGVLIGMAAGLLAGVAVSAGAQSPEGSPPPSDYEIVRTTFTGVTGTIEGTARCSEGKLVMGGGGRVVARQGYAYAMVASDPTGPYGWTATFVRPEEEPPGEPPEEPPPGEAEENGALVPGSLTPAQEDQEDPPPEEPDVPSGPAEFEVSAVCAAVG